MRVGNPHLPLKLVFWAVQVIAIVHLSFPIEVVHDCIVLVQENMYSSVLAIYVQTMCA